MKREATARVTSFVLRILLVLFVVHVVHGSTAVAQGTEKAKEHYRRGVTEYNLGHFEAAIKAFEKAYTIDPSPILLFNIGQAHRKLGNDSRAVFFFRRYLAQNPSAKDRSQVEEWIREMEGATSGQPGQAPRPLVPAPPSQRRTEAPAEPGPVPSQPQPIGRDATAPAAPKTAASVPGPSPIVADSPETASPSWRSPAAWITASVALVALAVGLQQNAAYARHNEDFEKPGLCGEAEDDRGSPECRRIYEDGERAKTVAIVGYVAGGILAAASVALFATSGSSEPPPRTAFVPRCRLAGPGASCAFSF